jgi:hypothetical protein
MPDRDPRYNPRPGDALRGPRGGRRWVEDVTGRALRDGPDVVRVRWHGPDGRSHTVPLSTWRRWARRAEVLDR